MNLPKVREHLVPFNLRKTPSLSCGVLVVGSGIAGCSAALAAALSTDVILLAKGTYFDTNTYHAQGGIAAPVLPSDSWEKHVQDTLATGGGLSEEKVVKEVCSHARETIDFLGQWGVSFDVDEQGNLDLHQEGGHSSPRILHARGDQTGKAVQETLAGRVVSHPAITCFENCFVLELLVQDGRCRGALVSSAEKGLMALWAERVILATGGGGQIYRETTNPSVATGDGLALAFRAGATLRDLELVQFHPTALYLAGAARFLISESVRGAGAVLLDRKGRPIMEGVHPSKDLAPRDVVSRAIFRSMLDTRETHVFLDLRPIPGDLRLRFPAISEVCSSFGIDVKKEPIPVRPAAHYFVGGIKVDPWGRSDLPGLYAVGEVASTGLHGANRLASNSLLEAAWFGHQAGLHAGRNLTGEAQGYPVSVELSLRRGGRPETELNVYDMIYSLKALMERHVGILREGAGIEEAVARLSFWSRCILDRELDRPRKWELANMLLLGGLMAQAARWRRESRGVHFREDYPERDDLRFRRHSLVRYDPRRGEVLFSSEEVGGTPS